MIPAGQILLILLSAILAGSIVGILLKPFVRKRIAKQLKTEGGQGEGSDAAEVERIRAKDRADARALYERVVRDKLDVIKTALTMGYDRKDIEALDTRLEKLIGSEKLNNLITADGAPEIDSALLDTDITAEVDRLRESMSERE